MARMSECAKCRYLLECEDGTGGGARFTDETLTKCPKGCHALISDELVKELIDRVQTRLSRDRPKRPNRETYQKEIREKIAEKRAALVLGAGISIPMGMPNWQGLVSQMSGSVFQYQDYMEKGNSAERKNLLDIERKLISGDLKIFNNNNVLESGQYIAQALGSAAKEKTGDELLAEVVSAIIERSKRPSQWLREHPLSEKEPDDLMKAGKNSLFAAAYVLKNGFRHALTYNFDTLTQESLIEIFHVSPERIITHPGEWSEVLPHDAGDLIEIFHVHGCIPRRANLEPPSPAFPKESSQIILSEDSYYNTERYEAYNWQNSIQSYYLNRDSCVFVGFSAEDYNFRRILRQMGDASKSKPKRPRHYLILTVDSMVRDVWKNVCRSRLPEGASIEEIKEDSTLLLARQLEMKEAYWKRYDFFPIWTTIPEIPEFLLSLLA